MPPKVSSRVPKERRLVRPRCALSPLERQQFETVGSQRRCLLCGKLLPNTSEFVALLHLNRDPAKGRGGCTAKHVLEELRALQPRGAPPERLPGGMLRRRLQRLGFKLPPEGTTDREWWDSQWTGKCPQCGQDGLLCNGKMHKFKSWRSVAQHMRLHGHRVPADGALAREGAGPATSRKRTAGSASEAPAGKRPRRAGAAVEPPFESDSFDEDVTEDSSDESTTEDSSDQDPDGAAALPPDVVRRAAHDFCCDVLRVRAKLGRMCRQRGQRLPRDQRLLHAAVLAVDPDRD
eukprot:TRINITY_DN25428_c0_g1_i1.p1 TRINITY_DN25428_c0_g1~~TRINITY_DN25428_c0_g1_i1.p1  ORF type:complete len:319 (+),score=65.17 TRINITY_DN25428_c0_g1_i1:85-957(+)